MGSDSQCACVCNVFVRASMGHCEGGKEHAFIWEWQWRSSSDQNHTKLVCGKAFVVRKKHLFIFYSETYGTMNLRISRWRNRLSRYSQFTFAIFRRSRKRKQQELTRGSGCYIKIRNMDIVSCANTPHTDTSTYTNAHVSVKGSERTIQYNK